YEHPTITGGFDDADGADGIANGLKYAFGVAPSTSGLPGDEVVVDPEFLILQRDLDSLRDGVVYGAEFSQDLDGWSPVGVIISHADGVLRATVDRPDLSGFLRWKITEE
ncbi:MAG: hypothetical protein AAGB14_16295, partial [Verrucomicrobiota bacterium]